MHRASGGPIWKKYFIATDLADLKFEASSRPANALMQIVDTHQHLWDIDLFRYSWLDSVPQLNRSFRMALDIFSRSRTERGEVRTPGSRRR